MKETNTPYFWGPRRVPILFLLFPLLVVSIGSELLLFFPETNPGIVETVVVVPPVLVGVLLLNSASKFKIEIAEDNPTHYLARWNGVRTFSNIALVASGLLALYAIAATSNILRGNFLEIFVEAFAILCLIDVYTMLLPLRFWSPKPSDFARMYFAEMLERTDAQAKYLGDALRWFSRSYAKKTGLPLQRRIFKNALSLDHNGRRNLALRLQHAVVSGDYEDGVQALMTSINTAREAVLADRRTFRDILLESEEGKIAISALVGLAVLLVAYASAVSLGSGAVNAFRNEIGLLLLGAGSLAAIVWTGLRKV